MMPGTQRSESAFATFLFWAMDVVREQFDKVLLVWLLIFFVSLVFVGAADPESQHWLRELASGVLGALLGLITGVKIGQGMVRVNPPTDLPTAAGGKQTSTLTDTTIREIKPEEKG